MGNHYVCVTGGRHYDDREEMADVIVFLDRFYGSKLRLMHGAAPGADTMAGDMASALGVPVKEFPADWIGHGTAAGTIRNQRMVDYLVDVCRRNGHSVQVVAFRGGKGTLDMVARAEAADIDVDRIAWAGG